MRLVDSADRLHVEKTIVLLRLARALNLGRSRAVERVRIAVHEAEVKLTLVPRRRMGVDLEQWAVEKERDYFREVFGRELSTALS
jgi:exopolyphosphatase/guanosine-5'-triphosphate,3'-diphosphate pyrophosphatase